MQIDALTHRPRQQRDSCDIQPLRNRRRLITIELVPQHIDVAVGVAYLQLTTTLTGNRPPTRDNHQSPQHPFISPLSNWRTSTANGEGNHGVFAASLEPSSDRRAGASV